MASASLGKGNSFNQLLMPSIGLISDTMEKPSNAIIIIVAIIRIVAEGVRSN